VRREATALLLVLAASCNRSSQRAPDPPRPAPAAAHAGSNWNVLLITIDTLRADHLGAYGYRRATSPHIDAFAKNSMVFDQAYTFWPKTRGSFVMIMTGRRPSQNGYGKQHQEVLGWNATLAGTLKEAGYATAAVVDNANVSSEWGYGKGFERYRETWKEIPEPAREMDRARMITEDAVTFLGQPPAAKPFFLWLHYVNPHGPYTPPPPYDTKFLDEASRSGPVLKAVKGFHDGVREEWAKPGQRLGYYVAQYDGEIAAADEQVGRVLEALAKSPVAARTLVILASDHGESLGEHGYFFDHGEDLYDPCLRIPLVIRVPGTSGGRTAALASTLDLMPTILDAVKVQRFPPDLAGRSLLAEASGRADKAPERLFAQNERNLSAAFDDKLKLVAVPKGETAWTFSLYDRQADGSEARDASGAKPDALRTWRRELELFWDRGEREMAAVRSEHGEARPTSDCMDPAVCENLKALGYISADVKCVPCP
jgi:arylsulfatase